MFAEEKADTMSTVSLPQCWGILTANSSHKEWFHFSYNPHHTVRHSEGMKGPFPQGFADNKENSQ